MIEVWVIGVFSFIAVVGIFVLLRSRISNRSNRAIEIVVKDGEETVEGVLRWLESAIQPHDSVTVTVIVNCTTCSDQTIDIVDRLHSRRPWFKYHLVEAGQLETAESEQMAGDGSVRQGREKCRVELTKDSNPRDVIKYVKSWLEKNGKTGL